MKRVSNAIDNFTLIGNSFFFLRDHFWVILGLCLVAAFVRVIQLGGFGETEPWMNPALEAVVEGSRILMFLFVLGVANIKKGLLQIGYLFSAQMEWRKHWSNTKKNIKMNWVYLSMNLIGFAAIAGVFNLLIDQLAYETCLFLSLKQGGILSNTSSEWTILLFFKNILVIPFTLVFETMLILWITGKQDTAFKGNTFVQK